jgi:hypothetical protein
VEAIFIHPKPIVVGGRVFGKDGWESALLKMTFLIIGHYVKKDVSNLKF